MYNDLNFQDHQMRKALLLIFTFLSFSYSYSQTKYVTTIHPFQEILKNIIGDRGEVYQILPPSASPHTYELRPSDVRLVESSKALFYGSENLDAWALKFQNVNRIELIKLIVKDSLIYFQEYTQDQKPGVYQKGKESLGHDHSVGIDPHFWTDPLTVQSMLPSLVEKLCALDPDGCETFMQNSKQFSRQLNNLDAKLREMLAPIYGSKVMISHPFFQYFFKRYGIKLIGVIEKNPGREPTPKDIKSLIDQVKHENVKAIFDHTQLPDRAAKILAESTGIKCYHLDPVGGVPGRQSYEELLLYNAKIILEALR
jgi:zinc transport system substrate-binding protein